MQSLTPQQQRICQFVATYRQQHRVSPTYLEIGEHLGVTKQAVQYQVKLLESLGMLAKPRDARSLMVTPAWERYRRHRLDRDTNPQVPVVAEECPELFEQFDEADWETLYSTRGVGGALTREGVADVAQRINENRRIRQQVAELLENGSVRGELIEVIADLWKQVCLSPGKGRSRSRRSGIRGQKAGERQA
jgi:hypothetical protein